MNRRTFIGNTALATAGVALAPGLQAEEPVERWIYEEITSLGWSPEKRGFFWYKAQEDGWCDRGGGEVVLVAKYPFVVCPAEDFRPELDLSRVTLEELSDRFAITNCSIMWPTQPDGCVLLPAEARKTNQIGISVDLLSLLGETLDSPELKELAPSPLMGAGVRFTWT